MNETSLKSSRNPAPSCSRTKVLSTEQLFLLRNIIASSEQYQVKFPMLAPKNWNFKCMTLLVELYSVRLVLSAGTDRNDWQCELATVSSLPYSFSSSSLSVLSILFWLLSFAMLSSLHCSTVLHICTNAHSLKWVVAFSHMPSNPCPPSFILSIFLTINKYITDNIQNVFRKMKKIIIRSCTEFFTICKTHLVLFKV